MNLYEQQPYWLLKNGIIATYPSLSTDLSVDVAVIGAGISGALTAWHLRNTGLSIAVMDKRHAGMGSTAASTSFLQYEIDTPLTKLFHYVGEQNALASYRLCREAIYGIAAICKSLKPGFDFKLRPSLQYASYKTHRKDLLKEYQARKLHGFRVNWMEPEDIMEMFGFNAPGAVLSDDGAEADAYLLTHSLLKDLKEKGHQVFNNTDIKTISYDKQGVNMQTAGDNKIRAKKLIIACGYESLQYIPKKIADIYSTYAFVSEPLPDKDFWYRKSLVWETANPYLYFRTTGDERILVGGRDDPFHPPHISAAVIKRKTQQLQQAFNKRMPHIPLKPDFSWAGAFAVTKDGLPYIGTIPERPHTFFALGFGGNGITFSLIAAEIINDIITGRKNKHQDLFRFNR